MGDRISTFTVEGAVLELFVSDCAACGVVFGIPATLETRRRQDKGSFYCPNGHSLVFKGKTDQQKLRDERARNTALQDQLGAAVRDAEAARVEQLRLLSRIARGVCPCCTRSFANVRGHMATKHPEVLVPARKQSTNPYRCSCGRAFGSFAGLRRHQTHNRDESWDEPTTSRYYAHLTVVAGR